VLRRLAAARRVVLRLRSTKYTTKKEKKQCRTHGFSPCKE
jgi:hypothetical protein